MSWQTNGRIKRARVSDSSSVYVGRIYLKNHNITPKLAVAMEYRKAIDKVRNKEYNTGCGTLKVS